jgi:hypothetical protein
VAFDGEHALREPLLAQAWRDQQVLHHFVAGDVEPQGQQARVQRRLHTVVAAAHGVPGTDVREGFRQHGRVLAHQLPARVSENILQLMARLNLRTASLDLGVVGDRHYLLDVNESGNFLWTEDKLPSLRLGEFFATQLLERK